ncbi:Serine/threonine protein kinase [Giardia duodenalis]|uniref:Serine/threonine protein kinase n=2 Tax=Giardia intestinalis TaxID=5741 RepID=V6TSP4_GIAIN|nr:Serine/threonine protein kinase [Giardia intestinalis]
MISSNLLKIVMADRDDTVPDPASERPGIPQFTARDLHELMENELSEGSYGTVYSLRGFPGLAVKEIRIDGQNKNVTRAISFEIAVLIKLSHPNIIRYHQVIEDGDFIYIIMDQYDGNLEHFLTKHKRKRIQVPTELIYSILEQIISALAYLHGVQGVDANRDPYQGIVHRDLKPANILVSEDGSKIALADFRLCRSAMTSGTTRAGSPAYMASETLLYNSTSPASDIWALGVIIYELATLKRLDFLGDKEPRHVFTSGWKPDLSAIEDVSIRIILERIFVLDPEERPTAKELAGIFQAPSTSPEGHSPHTTAWETAMKDANARIASLERERSIMSAEMDALRKELEALKLANKHADKHDEEASQVKEALTPEEVDNSGVTAPKKAGTRNDVEAVKALVTKQKKLRNSDGRTALMHAAESGSTDALRILLEYEKGMKDNQDHNALYHALKNGHTEAAKVIVPHNDSTDRNDITGLMQAAERNDLKVVRELIPLQRKRRADRITINGWIIFKETALMRAVICGHLEVARLLMEHEGSLKDGIGRTALIFAAKSGHAECVELLLEKEASIRDNQSWTALMWAVYNNKLECAKLLLEKEACMQARNGMTALMYAAENGHVECVNLLVAKEGSMQNRWGSTALMIAAERNHVECVRLLTEKEKDIKTTRTWSGFPPGTTALDIAKERGHTEIVSILNDE